MAIYWQLEISVVTFCARNSDVDMVDMVSFSINRKSEFMKE